MYMYKKVIFISDVKDPTKDASFTQIMVRNILAGIKLLNVNIVFMANVDGSCNSC